MSAADRRHVIDDALTGWLESPCRTSPAQSRFVVSGWIFSTATPIERLIVRIGTFSRSVAIDRDRIDVAAVYPTERGALRTGFHATLETPTPPSRSTPLEIWVLLASGVERRAFRWIPSPTRGFLARVVRRRTLEPHDLPVARRAVHDRVRERDRELELDLFLQSRGILDFSNERPRVTVVVPTWNRAQLTFGCLRALRQSSVPLQVVVVDNGSTDLTPALLRAIRGATIICNESNLGFVMASNQGAAAAVAEFVLFLNNDAEVLPGAIEALLAAIERDARIGAVGGRLVWPDGLLQEAGSIVWRDGTCEGYGRGAHPAAGEYSFRRDVDYCSAALLLTRRALFHELGGFDARYHPAYYEDVDYCVRLWRRGYRVSFEPRAVAIHVEFASSQSPDAALTLQARNHAVFATAHADWLAGQCARADGVLRARNRPHDRTRLLYIDDMLPDSSWGSGFPRAVEFLRAIASRYAVTVFATRADARRDQLGGFLDIETIEGLGGERLGAFLADRRGVFDLIIVSRSHNMEFLRAAFPNLGELGIPVIYDAEAINALRDVLQARVLGSPLSPHAEAARVRDEILLADGCPLVLAVSELERKRFAEHGHRTLVLGHAVDAHGGRNPFDKRNSVLFIGAFAWGGPNLDAATLLVSSIYPALQRLAADPPPIVIGGRGASTLRLGAPMPGLSLQEGGEDLEPLYERARVFLAPTRFAAGIPLKIVEAAARGVPVVCSSLLAEQLGWQPGDELLTADTPDGCAEAILGLFGDEVLWSRIRANALARVRIEYAEAAFARTACAAVDHVLGEASSRAVRHDQTDAAVPGPSTMMESVSSNPVA